MSESPPKSSDGAPPSSDPSPSISFGKYELFASLGRGGMADVFLSVARGPMGFNKLAVVKRLRRTLAEEPTFLAMFLDEARLAARLNHPNIVHTYEVGEHASSYFIAMEYLDGQPLNKIIRASLKRKEQLDEAFCARVVMDALNGLEHAHKLCDYDGSPLAIIHRDVSPHNIFVTYDGHTKLVDFGIAKAATSSTETEVGVLKGKVAYMSPEQASGNKVDQRADLFAMGIVLWEMLSGERLMRGDSTANTLHKLMSLPIPRVSERRVVAPALEAIVARALEKDPDVRFSSAGEMREALEAYLDELPTPYRSDDVSRHVCELFARVREEAQRQVQKHMAAIGKKEAASKERTAKDVLTLDSVRRLERTGAALLRLSETGSGVRAMVTGQTQIGQTGSFVGTFPRDAEKWARSPRSSVVPWAVALVLLGIVAVSAVVVAVRASAPHGGSPEASSSSSSSSSSSPASSEPVAISSATLASTSANEPTTPVPAIPSPSSSSSSSTPQVPSAAPGKSAHVTAGSGPSAASVKPESSSASLSPGYLTFDTYPWTRVFEHGKLLGATPLVKVALAPGVHVLTFENEEQAVSHTQSVTIKSGEVTVGRLGLK